VTETEEALRDKVSGVYKNYYLQVWNEALNQAEVEASSILRRAESVYYPLLFVPPPLVAPRQTLLLRWHHLRRTAQTKSLPPLAALQKRPSSLGLPLIFFLALAS